jgi:hypothetical protein
LSKLNAVNGFCLFGLGTRPGFTLLQVTKFNKRFSGLDSLFTIGK